MPVSDKRLSMRPHSAHSTLSQARNSFERHLTKKAHTAVLPRPHSADRPPNQLAETISPFPNKSTYSSPPLSSLSRSRRPGHPRTKSEANSLQGGFLPSERSASISLAESSVVDPGPPIDARDWDDAATRKQEGDQLFYRRSNSGRPDSGH